MLFCTGVVLHASLEVPWTGPQGVRSRAGGAHLALVHTLLLLDLMQRLHWLQLGSHNVQNVALEFIGHCGKFAQSEIAHFSERHGRPETKAAVRLRENGLSDNGYGQSNQN